MIKCKITDRFSRKTSCAEFFNIIFILGNEQTHFIVFFIQKRNTNWDFLEISVGTPFTKITTFQNVTLLANGKWSFFVLSKQKKRYQISNRLCSYYIRSTSFTYWNNFYECYSLTFDFLVKKRRRCGISDKISGKHPVPEWQFLENARFSW